MFHADVLAEQARHHGSRTAAVDVHQDVSRTYRELDARASALARAMRLRGVTPGTSVAWIAWNRIEMLEALFACVRLGASLVALNPRSTAWELSRKLALTEFPLLIVERQVLEVQPAALTVGRGSTCLVLDHDGEDAYERAIGTTSGRLDLASDASPEAIAAVLFTSGSTAAPRGARLSQRMLAGNALVTVAAWQLTPGTVAGIVSPMWHAGGFGALLLPALLAGGTLVILRQAEPTTFWPSLRRHGAQVLFGVPTLWLQALEWPGLHEMSGRLRWLLSGGAPLPRRIATRYDALGVPLRQGFGMTEAGINLATESGEDAATAPGTVGRPLPWVDVQIVDAEGADLPPGEIGAVIVGGPCVADGYLGPADPEDGTFRPDGRVDTGDLGSLDDAGRLRITGRSKHVFVTSGFTVSPAEVELALLESSGVSEAVVVATPHPTLGEVGVAFVVPGRRGDVDTEGLQAALRDRLSGYKIPTRIEVVAELPRTSSGKVDRRALVDRPAAES
jgi:fatty-acyl-CoA synthase